jgi:hypothetical protein
MATFDRGECDQQAASYVLIEEVVARSLIKANNGPERRSSSPAGTSSAGQSKRRQ